MVLAWGSLRMLKKCQVGLQSAEGSPGIWRSSFQDDSLRWLLNQGWWLVESFSSLQNGHLHRAAWQGEWSKRKQDGSCTVRWPSFSSHTIIPSVSCWLHRLALFSIRRTTQEHKQQEVRIIGDHLGDWRPQFIILAPMIHVLPTCKIH